MALFCTVIYIHSCIDGAGSSGSFFRNFTWDEIWEHGLKEFVLNVTAVDPNSGDNVTLRGAFRVFGHQEKYVCSLNMINTGTRPLPQGGYLEFISVGKATEFTCTIDDGATQLCKLLIFAVITTVIPSSII